MGVVDEDGVRVLVLHVPRGERHFFVAEVNTSVVSAEVKLGVFVFKTGVGSGRGGEAKAGRQGGREGGSA